jgi:hypothetical protein
MIVISAAAQQYANRPADERFPSLDAMIANARHDKDLSVERSYNLKDLRAVASDNTVKLQSPKGTAVFSHWAFGQTARMLGAPASYLRNLSPALAADCLNYGFEHSTPGTTANVLVRAANGVPEPTIRACTSDSYGRAWDADLYGSIAHTIVAHDSRWSLPPTWSGENAGAYRGDRDSFLILVNGGSIVNDPSAANGNGQMFRGILVRNSEVGASSVVLDSILFRYVCGNHNLWGAVMDRSFKRRHVGSHVTRDTIREIARMAMNYTSQSVARDEAIVRGLIQHEIAHTREAVVDELRAIGATKEQAEDALKACEMHENASPRSFWGVAQGLTRVSQDTTYQDDRFLLDQLAAKVLARGAKLVAA